MATEKTNLVVTVSGKGGVGRTIVTTLTVRLLSEATDPSILVVDANPDSKRKGSS